MPIRTSPAAVEAPPFADCSPEVRAAASKAASAAIVATLREMKAALVEGREVKPEPKEKAQDSRHAA